jgi:WD40 repeat protein
LIGLIGYPKLARDRNQSISKKLSGRRTMKTIFGIVVTSLFLAGVTSAQEFGPWSQPVNLGAAINTSFDDMHPSLSKDSLSLYFSSNRPGGAGLLDLWVSQRDSLDDAWQAPQNLTMLNSSSDDHAANLTDDGHWLFFFSARPGGCNGGQRTELWASHRRNKRDDLGWDQPINLGCTLNAPGTDSGAPGHWQDDTGIHYLYFARNYTPANPQGFSIYVSTCTAELESCIQQQLWSSPVYVAELSSPGFRTTKTGIRHRDGLEIIVSSMRPGAGAVGGHDLWVSTRPSAGDPWSIPVNLNLDNQAKCLQVNINPGSCPAVNTTANDSAAALSWDGQTIMFYSNRPGGYGGNDLYISTRQKLRGKGER